MANNDKKSFLLNRRPIEPPSPLETAWHKHFTKLMEQIHGKGEQEINNMLVSQASKPDKQQEITQGLLFAILTEKTNNDKYFQYLTFITRDEFKYSIEMVQRLVLDNYPSIRDTARPQVLWLIQEFIKVRAKDTHLVIQALLRQVVIGNHKKLNLWLIDNIVMLLGANITWLLDQQALIPHLVYKLLSIIPDHFGHNLQDLRKKEANLCVHLMKERFAYIQVIGRDFLRVFHNVARVPEFVEPWQRLNNDPQSFDPNLKSIMDIARMKTNRIFLLGCLTPQMETQLYFVMTKVKFGNQTRYQQWFASSHLSTNYCDHLIPSLIRYICCVYHPTNRIIASEVCPRWAVIGWLLKLLKTPHGSANGKLALFYDYLFFVPGVDSIMNVEPALLLMMRSIPKYIDITATLIEFLLLLLENYSPQHQAQIKTGVHNAFRIMLEKKVVASIDPMYNCQLLSDTIRDSIKKHLAPFVTIVEPKEQPNAEGRHNAAQLAHRVSAMDIDPQPQKNRQQSSPAKKDVRKEPLARTLTPPLNPEAKKRKRGQPNGDESPPKKIRKVDLQRTKSSVDVMEQWKTMQQQENNAKEKKSQKGAKKKKHTSAGTGERTSLFAFDAALTNLRKLVTEDKEQAIKVLRRILDTYLGLVSASEDNTDNLTHELAIQLVDCLYPELKTAETSVLLDKDTTQLQAYEQIFKLYNDNPKNSSLLHLIKEMQDEEDSIGFRFMCFLIKENGYYKDESKINDSDDTFSTYLASLEANNEIRDAAGDKARVFAPYIKYLKCRGANKKSERHQYIVQDSRTCAEFSPQLFLSLVLYLLRHLHVYTVGNTNMVHLLVSTTYPAKLREIACCVRLGDIAVVGTQLDKILSKSLEWDSFSQYCLWDIIKAEFGASVDDALGPLLELLPLLNPQRHNEALSGITTLLQDKPPSRVLVEALLRLPVAFGKFVASLLGKWNTDEILDHINIVLTNLARGNAEKKRSAAEETLRQLTIWATIYKEATRGLRNHEKTIKSLRHVMHRFKIQDDFSLLDSLCGDGDAMDEDNDT